MIRGFFRVMSVPFVCIFCLVPWAPRCFLATVAFGFSRTGTEVKLLLELKASIEPKRQLLGERRLVKDLFGFWRENQTVLDFRN